VKSTLDVDRGGHRIRGAGERHDAFVFFLQQPPHTAVPRYRLVKQFVVAGDSGTHHPGSTLLQRRRTLNVGA